MQYWQTTRFRIDLARPQVMGIVNVTPDSFSDGGRHDTPQAALAHCERLLRDGAQLLDIGGESTRPGSPPVPLEVELARVLPILREAVRHDFPVNMLCWGNLEAGTALIDRHPETRVIIDHLGIMQPHAPPAPAEPWADLPRVLELARRPNAVIKVSGACTLSREPYPFNDIWDPLARVFDAWGFERCLWGTDWTRAFPVVNFEQAVEPFRMTDRLSESERALLMGGACAKAYRWTPTKG